MELNGTIWVYGTIWDYLGLSRTNKDYLGLSGTRVQVEAGENKFFAI